MQTGKHYSTLWLGDSVFTPWEAITPEQKVVGLKTYPDCVILRLPGPSDAGIISACGRQPDSSALCLSCRAKVTWQCPITPPRAAGRATRRWPLLPAGSEGRHIAIAIDATCLKKGNGKSGSTAHQRGIPGVGLHIAIDMDTQEIISVSLTTNGEDDGWPVAVQTIKGKTGTVEELPWRWRLRHIHAEKNPVPPGQTHPNG